MRWWYRVARGVWLAVVCVRVCLGLLSLCLCVQIRIPRCAYKRTHGRKRNHGSRTRDLEYTMCYMQRAKREQEFVYTPIWDVCVCVAVGVFVFVCVYMLSPSA